MAEPVHVVIEEDDDTTKVDPVTGTVETRQPDGGVVVQLDAARPKKDDDEGNPFYENLAKKLPESKLNAMAEELIEAIDMDDRSREGYLANVAYAMDLLGLKLQKPKSIASDTAAPVEGMSSVTNPLLLEAMLRGWANTVGELLPSGGPVKVKEVATETVQDDDLADALERDFNHYLTDIATEYYPDTSHMLLWGPYFKGSGFKKVYRCPMRRRPVSESVEAKDLIVSDATKDLRSCGRITHQILMRPSVMKRMKLLGAYVDVSQVQPEPRPNTVDEKIAGIQGTTTQNVRPEDKPFTIWETQCEFDLKDDDDKVPSKFKGEGLPLPYLVTIDKDSRKILALRRDWNEDDEECHRKRMYVKYPYVPGPGFYGTGMLNILGNASAAMTAAWREALDAGMYANFPAGLMAKLGSRQNSNILRLSPGEFPQIETNGMPIGNVVMGLPYKDVTAGLLSLIDKIVAQAKSVGGSADIPAAEGVQNVPVGTMLAQIEQATKVMAAAHKGMHQAQSEEIQLILDLFRENPEDFWRGNKVCPRDYWTEQKFMVAVGNCNLVPASDPNVPSHIYRVAKATALAQLQTNPAFAPFMVPKETLMRILRAMKEDENGLVQDPPPPQAAGPDPNAMAAYAKMESAKAATMAAQTRAAESQQKMALEPQKLQTQRDIATTELAREYVIHGKDQADMARQAQMQRADHGLKTLQVLHGIAQDHREHAMEAAQAGHERQMDHLGHRLEQGGLVHEAVHAAHERHMAEREHALNVHEALHPPEPKAAQGRAHGGRVQHIPEGAKLAPDGRHYLPDPARPGKWLLVAH